VRSDKNLATRQGCDTNVGGGCGDGCGLCAVVVVVCVVCVRARARVCVCVCACVVCVVVDACRRVHDVVGGGGWAVEESRRLNKM
jgi:hypothetical protein